MQKKNETENNEMIFGCSVVLNRENVLNFHGGKKEIGQKLKFLKNSLYTVEELENEEDYFLLPVILTEQDDVTGVTVFYLRDWEDNL